MRRTAISCAAVGMMLAGCSTLGGARCPAGLHRAQMAELFFGRSTAAVETVSDADWQAFVAAEVTPRLPGETVFGPWARGRRAHARQDASGLKGGIIRPPRWATLLYTSDALSEKHI